MSAVVDEGRLNVPTFNHESVKSHSLILTVESPVALPPRHTHAQCHVGIGGHDTHGLNSIGDHVVNVAGDVDVTTPISTCQNAA
jgi:hypothetical protein